MPYRNAFIAPPRIRDAVPYRLRHSRTPLPSFYRMQLRVVCITFTVATFLRTYHLSIISRPDRRSLTHRQHKYLTSENTRKETNRRFWNSSFLLATVLEPLAPETIPQTLFKGNAGTEGFQNRLTGTATGSSCSESGCSRNESGCGRNESSATTRKQARS